MPELVIDLLNRGRVLMQIQYEWPVPEFEARRIVVSN